MVGRDEVRQFGVVPKDERGSAVAVRDVGRQVASDGKRGARPQVLHHVLGFRAHRDSSRTADARFALEKELHGVGLGSGWKLD